MLFVDSFRNRYDMKAADAMLEKYVTKSKKPLKSK
jgi:hypothetical protein